MMKMPTTAPRFNPGDLKSLLPHLTNPTLADLVRKVDRDYLHWDQLRHKPMPAGISAEQVWAVVQLERRANRRPLPLIAEAGDAFGYSLPAHASEILHQIDRHGARRGSHMRSVDEDFVQVLGSEREQVVLTTLMDEAIATSQIEGAATTRKVAKEMLLTERAPRDRNEQMIVNSYRTIRLLRERIDRPLSLELLFEIQESMTVDTLDDPTAIGRFRTLEDDIAIVEVGTGKVLFSPPSPAAISGRMGKLIAFANEPGNAGGFIHPLVKAAILHFWLAYEHPFVDGNGRTARALFYWFMLKNGYWLFDYLTISRILAEKRISYYRSFLYCETDNEDLTYSILLQIDATRRALENLKAELEKRREDDRLVAATLRDTAALNHRQRQVVGHALRHPDRLYTFKGHQKLHGITSVTARNDLIDLETRGYFVPAREGKQRAFLPARGLAEILRRQQTAARTKPS